MVVGGIREDDQETGAVCEQLVRTFFKEHLKMTPADVDAMRFERCHRLSNYGGNRNQGGHQWPRQIIVRFYDYSQRQSVITARKQLVDKSLTVSENYCGDTSFKRRKLYPIYRKAKGMLKYKKVVLCWIKSLR